MKLSRLERMWLRSFFTLPKSLKEKPNNGLALMRNKEFSTILNETGVINFQGQSYFIIWLSHPFKLNEDSKIDLSFRDYSNYGEVPVVLIREAI